MTVKHATVSVGTTPVSLASGADDTGITSDIARSLLLTNQGTASVFLGGTGVTTTDYGYELRSGAEAGFDLGPGEDLFAIVATGTATVRVLHTGS